jgi:hypothetical protein
MSFALVLYNRLQTGITDNGEIDIKPEGADAVMKARRVE